MDKREIEAMVREVETRCGPFCSCEELDIHGMPHLRQVALTAGRLAVLVGCDVESAVVAGFLHDCARVHDGGGNRHAHDSAVLARRLLKTFYPHLDAPRLCEAIARHADGRTTDDPLAACLWDADRLDLCRLGIEADPRLLSTRAARRVAAIRRRRREDLHPGYPQGRAE